MFAAKLSLSCLEVVKATLCLGLCDLARLGTRGDTSVGGSTNRASECQAKSAATENAAMESVAVSY